MSTPNIRWTDSLDDEELAFVRHFVRASGSLKDLATRYGVSYPTVRSRMDRLIQKMEILDKFHDRSETEKKLRAYYAEGHIPDHVFKSLLQTAKKEIQS